MGRRGPPKKPTELKLIEGCPGGKHKLNAGEPKPKKVTGTKPPRDLSKEAKKIWRDIAPKLEKSSLLTELDLAALARYCDLRVRWMGARDFLEKNGPVYAIYHEQTPEERAAGKKPRLKYMAQFPQVNIYHQLAKALKDIEDRFGMSPSARSSINVRPSADKRSEVKRLLYGGE
mgnify:CR=1 FL=1